MTGLGKARRNYKKEEMKNSLSSLPPGLLTAWYRSQPEEVKTNVRLALGAFVSIKLNSGKDNKTNKTK